MPRSLLAVVLLCALAAPSAAGRPSRLQRQLDFLGTLEKLKAVQRRNIIVDGSRRENPAEHSWQMATMAIVLSEHAPPGMRLEKAIKMALLHDVIEIHADDTYAYDKQANLTKDAREKAAAKKIFSLLPRDQRRELIGLWREFEQGKTPEAKFVRTLDRLQPVFLHRLTGGAAWKEHEVSKAQVLERVAEVKTNTPSLWPVLKRTLDRAQREQQLR